LLLRAPLVRLFPYTTLFRSLLGGQVERNAHGAERGADLDLLSVEDDLLIRGGQYRDRHPFAVVEFNGMTDAAFEAGFDDALGGRSEEHTSELQSRFDLVCRL